MINIFLLVISFIISYICFEMLPIGFQSGGIYITAIAIILAALYCYFNDNLETNGYKKHMSARDNIFLGMGSYSVFLCSPKDGLKSVTIILAFLVAHRIKNLLINKSLQFNWKKTILNYLSMIAFFIIGIVITVVATAVSNIFISIFIGFSSGIILYNGFDEILPIKFSDKQFISRVIFISIGFILGIVVK